MPFDCTHVQLFTSELVEGPFHRIEGFRRTGKNPKLEELPKRLRQCRDRQLASVEDLAIGEPELRDGHSVLGQSPGLVGA
jgi:hypothetical protein